MIGRRVLMGCTCCTREGVGMPMGTGACYQNSAQLGNCKLDWARITCSGEFLLAKIRICIQVKIPLFFLMLGAHGPHQASECEPKFLVSLLLRGIMELLLSFLSCHIAVVSVFCWSRTCSVVPGPDIPHSSPPPPQSCLE